VWKSVAAKCVLSHFWSFEKHTDGCIRLASYNFLIMVCVDLTHGLNGFWDIECLSQQIPKVILSMFGHLSSMQMASVNLQGTTSPITCSCFVIRVFCSLRSRWQCITDFSGLMIYVLMGWQTQLSNCLHSSSSHMVSCTFLCRWI